MLKIEIDKESPKWLDKEIKEKMIYLASVLNASSSDKYNHREIVLNVGDRYRSMIKTESYVELIYKDRVFKLVRIPEFEHWVLATNENMLRYLL